MRSTPSGLDVERLSAIDVHVHLEHTGSRVDADEAAAKYFGAGGDRDWNTLADYYRSRQTGCVVFTVDEKLTGRPQVSNDAVIEFAAQNADIAMAFVSLDPTRGADAVREARRLVAGGGVWGLKLHPPLQQFFPNDPVAYPLYEVFAEARLPVLFHTGHSGIGTGMPADARPVCEYTSQAQGAVRLRLPVADARSLARGFREDRHPRRGAAAHLERKRDAVAGSQP